MERRQRISDTYLGFFARIKRAEAGPLISGVRCLEWTGKPNEHGYGMHSWHGRPILAHRYAWQTFKAPIPVGANVCHKCDNPRCVEIAHLFIGTQAENMRDMTAKGRRVNAQPKGSAHGMAKLTEDDVRSVRSLSALAGMRHVDISKMYAVTKEMIGCIVNRKNWKHVN